MCVLYYEQITDYPATLCQNNVKKLFMDKTQCDNISV